MRDRPLILGAAIALVAAFVCPLVLGESWFFGPRLLADAPPGLRIMALVPGLVGPLALLAGLRLRPLPRAVVSLLAGGVGVIVLVGTLEALTAGQSDGLAQIFTRGAVVMPGPRGLLLFALSMAACFTGLAWARRDEDMGGRVAGVAGALLLALHLAPLGGRTPLGIVLDGVAWKTAWPIPVTLIVSGAFAVVCAAQLFPDHLPAGRSRRWLLGLAALIGLGAVLVLPVGLALDAAARSPELLATTVTMAVKIYGTWIALHALIVGGVLGLIGLSGKRTA